MEEKEGKEGKEHGNAGDIETERPTHRQTDTKEHGNAGDRPARALATSVGGGGGGGGVQCTVIHGDDYFLAPGFLSLLLSLLYCKDFTTVNTVSTIWFQVLVSVFYYCLYCDCLYYCYDCLYFLTPVPGLCLLLLSLL